MSTAQESSPSQLKTETTSKNSPTNKPKIDEATVVSDDPGSDRKSNSNNAKKEDAKALNKDTSAADPKLQVLEKPPSEDQNTSKNGSTEINKQEVDGTKAVQEDSAAVAEINPADSQVQPVKNESTSAADPKLQVLEKPPSEDQNTSKNGSTEINKQEVDGTKAVQEDSAAVAEINPADSQVQPVKNESTSKDSSPADQSIAATHGPEADGGKSLGEELPNKVEPDPPVQEISPADDEATPKELSPSKHTSPTKNGSTATNKQEVDGTKAVQEDTAAIAEITPADSQVQPVKNESTSKDSSPAGQSIAATHGPEADGGKSLGEELPNEVEPHPPAEISPAADEATPKGLSPPKNDSSPPKEDSTNLAEPCPKKPKWKKKLMNLIRLRKGKVSKPESSKPKSESPTSSQKLDDKKVQISSLIQADIDYIATRVEELEQYNKDLDETLKSARDEFEALQEKGKLEELQDLRKDTIKLKLQDPSKYKFDGDEKDRLKNLPFRSKAKQAISKEMLNKMPHLHKTGVFETSLDFKDFEARYSELNDRLKLCLLCFSVLPENIIRKRLMLQWWVSEGFVSEEKADEYFTQLIQKGFIEPVNDNRSLSVGRCQMHPFYRSALVMLAERAKFFNFGAKGEPTQNFSGSFQSCLMGEGLISFDDLKNGKLKTEDLEKLHLLINVDEHILEFRPDWFSRMTNLNFLHLGQWKVLATDHIEVEDTEFLSGLEKMSCVKFLSLQGISNIIALPKSILLMDNLEILDIRACYNLETIPESIDFLKNLIHLDMSECYLLDHMPKGLSLLRKLQVIKGFVVGTRDEKNKPCTLEDLENLPKLSKLCIYTDLVEFPEEPHVKALEKLKELCKLTITWGGNALRATPHDQPDNEYKKTSSTAENIKKKKKEPRGSSKGKLPPKLKKLDLKCFPKSTTPYWLELRNLKDLNLQKLYIRGGRLSDLGQYQDFDDYNIVPPVAKEPVEKEPFKKETWKVEVLRLKYLSEIKMEWRQLHELFPRLVYLEQVSCRNLTLFPCDANGVWINKENQRQPSSHAS